MTDPSNRLRRLILGDNADWRMSPLQRADCAQAVADLEADNSFALDQSPGPYDLHLSIQDGRCVLDVRSTTDQPLRTFGIALGPFRSLIKDYELMVDSHAMAVTEGREARIQAIDMGRRGLHNEGAVLLMQRLAGRISVDMETARRLFTLLCTLNASRCFS